MQTILVFFQNLHRRVQLSALDGKADVAHIIMSDGLQDNVDIDAVVCQKRKQTERMTRLVRNAHDSNSCCVFVAGYTADNHLFHRNNLLNLGSRISGQAGQHFQINVVLFCHLNRTVVQNLCAQRRQFQHFIKCDFLQLARIGYHTRICGIYTVYIGINLTQICAQRRRNGNRCRIRAAAPQRCDALMAVHTLKSCDNNNPMPIQQTANALRLHTMNAGCAVFQTRLNAGLPAGQTRGMIAQLFNRHREQRHRDLFACAEQHIHLSCRRLVCDFCCLFDKIVRGVALCGYHNNNLISGGRRSGYNIRDVKDAFCVRNGSSAELLHN